MDKPDSNARVISETKPASQGDNRVKVWKSKGRGKPKALGLIILIIIIVGGILLWRNYQQAPGSPTINKSEYQAVFLTNGQVYFGKVNYVDAYYLKLTDIYYLQVQQTVQPTTSSSSGNSTAQLVKLGNEIHGPEDEMTINRSQVLFWENLKASGKVTQAIDQYQK